MYIVNVYIVNDLLQLINGQRFYATTLLDLLSWGVNEYYIILSRYAIPKIVPPPRLFLRFLGLSERWVTVEIVHQPTSFLLVWFVTAAIVHRSRLFLHFLGLSERWVTVEIVHRPRLFFVAIVHRPRSFLPRSSLNERRLTAVIVKSLKLLNSRAEVLQNSAQVGTLQVLTLLANSIESINTALWKKLGLLLQAACKSGDLVSALSFDFSRSGGGCTYELLPLCREHPDFANIPGDWKSRLHQPASAVADF